MNAIRHFLAPIILLGASINGYAAPAALVEQVTLNPSSNTAVSAYSFLQPGEQIELAAGESLTLGYLESCVREQIFGGLITVGERQSTIQGGRFERSNLDCGGQLLSLAANESMQSGAIAHRVGEHDDAKLAALEAELEPLDLDSLGDLEAFASTPSVTAAPMPGSECSPNSLASESANSLGAATADDHSAQASDLKLFSTTPWFKVEGNGRFVIKGIHGTAGRCEINTEGAADQQHIIDFAERGLQLQAGGMYMVSFGSGMYSRSLTLQVMTDADNTPKPLLQRIVPL